MILVRLLARPWFLSAPGTLEAHKNLQNSKLVQNFPWLLPLSEYPYGALVIPRSFEGHEFSWSSWPIRFSFFLSVSPCLFPSFPQFNGFLWEIFLFSYFISIIPLEEPPDLGFQNLFAVLGEFIRVPGIFFQTKGQSECPWSQKFFPASRQGIKEVGESLDSKRSPRTTEGSTFGRTAL